MIEVIDAEQCTACDICVSVCPTNVFDKTEGIPRICLLYTSPSPRDGLLPRMPSSA